MYGLSICCDFSAEIRTAVMAGGYVLARLVILSQVLSFSKASSDELIVGRQTYPVLKNT